MNYRIPTHQAQHCSLLQSLLAFFQFCFLSKQEKATKKCQDLISLSFQHETQMKQLDISQREKAELVTVQQLKAIFQPIQMNLNFTIQFKINPLKMITMSTSPDHCFITTLQYSQCFNMILNMANSSSRLRHSVIHIRSLFWPWHSSYFLISSSSSEMSTTPQLIQNLQLAHSTSTVINA